MTGKTQGWIGVDLDGTLAEYHGWDGKSNANGGIGEPVELMRARVMAWLENGWDVRIFTARVAHDNTPWRMLQAQQQYAFILAWCQEHLGKMLPITCQKDMAMVELWDDRCVQVVRNTGEVVGFSDERNQEVFQ